MPVIDFVKIHLSSFVEQGKVCRVFDVPVSYLSKEDLIGLVGYLSEQMRKQQEDYNATWSFLSVCKKVK